MIKKVSLLWDTIDIYNEWKENITKRHQDYIYDLNLIQIFEEINSITSFLDFYIHKSVFLYPCSKGSTIQYRQHFIKELYENKDLENTARAYVIYMHEMNKKLIQINSTKDDIKRKIFYLQFLYQVLDTLQEYWVQFSDILSDDSPFQCVTNLLSEYVNTNYYKEAKQELSQYITHLNQEYSSNFVLNITNDGEFQKVQSAVIIDKNNIEKIGAGREDFTSRLSSISKFLFEDYDFTISVYQDTEITELDKKLQTRVMNNSPKLLEETCSLYDTYKGIDFDNFITIADDLIFYLSYLEFMDLYKQADFFFTLPKLIETNNIIVENAYDLSLGMNQYKNNKQNEVISNSYYFDDHNKFFVLTGANQGGKTTFIRSIGIIQCLFQIGLFVPAKVAKISVVNQVFTLFSKEDEQSAVVGRFEQELKEVQEILAKFKSEDMLLMNETFTSTQRTVAISLLKRILLRLHDRNCIGGLVTHYFEIMKELPKEYFYSLVTQVNPNSIYHKRTYKIVPMEPEYKSYANDIANKCGVTYDQLAHDILQRDEGGIGVDVF